MKDKVVLIGIAMIALILLGLVVSNSPIYSHDIQFEESDGKISFEYSSNIGMDTHTTMFSTTGKFDVREVVLLVDKDYASMSNESMLDEMADDLGAHFEVRGIGYRVVDSKEMVDTISSAVPSETALMIASGAIPDIIYDGSDSCPLMDWLDRGGVLINMSGCLGKYVSHGPEGTDIETISGFGFLFAGADDSAFMDSPNRLFTDQGYDPDFRDTLQIYLNEYTYGINTEMLGESLNVGYSIDGISAATLFRSGEGMIINFGNVLNNHVHSDYYVAQIIASGIDYSSTLLDHYDGDTRSDKSGEFTVPDGPFTIYGYIGTPRAVYGERFTG